MSYNLMPKRMRMVICCVKLYAKWAKIVPLLSIRSSAINRVWHMLFEKSCLSYLHCLISCLFINI